MSTESLSNIRQLFEKFFPDQTPRLRCLSLLAECIKHAHCYAPDEWVVRLSSNRSQIRLIVGDLKTVQIQSRKIWMALDAKELKAMPQSMTLLSEEQSWEWRAKDFSTSTYVPSRNGYYFPDKDPSEELLSIVQQLNFAFIKHIGNAKRNLRHSSRAKYEPEIIEFLNQELKKPIPEPGTDLELPEEISETAVFHEGARKKILVNAYERSRVARDKCLAHHGRHCAVCEQSMSEIYGWKAANLIHVHHLKPLSEIKEGYQVNPIEDMRPVCPNCHAVIHSQKPAYTIEEVRGFLEKARQDG